MQSPFSKFMILLSIITHSCRASGPSTSGTSTRDDGSWIIDYLFNSSNDPSVGDQLDLESVRIEIDTALAQDSGKYMWMRMLLLQLKKIIQANILGDC